MDEMPSDKEFAVKVAAGIIALQEEIATNKNLYEHYRKKWSDAENLLRDEREAGRVLGEIVVAADQHDKAVSSCMVRMDVSKLTIEDRGGMRHALAKWCVADQVAKANPIASAHIDAARKKT